MIVWLALLLAAANFAGLVRAILLDRFDWVLLLAAGCGASLAGAILA